MISSISVLISICVATLLPAGSSADADERSRFQIDEDAAREAIKLGQTEDVESLQKFFEPYNELFRSVTDPPVERITLDTRFSRIVTLAATQQRTEHRYTEKEAFSKMTVTITPIESPPIAIGRQPSFDISLSLASTSLGFPGSRCIEGA